jgi:predicted DNA-binding transcriptional regulator YafY
MYDPSMRVLTILEMLQTKERVPGSELAERLEVSPRTVQRYVARLQDLGVPVTSSKGRGASYRLKPSYTMPPLMFSSDEAFAVALGLHALQHIGLRTFSPAVVGVESKLERVLPAAIWGRMQTLSAALHLEKQGWIKEIDTAIVSDLALAIQSRQVVRIEYENHQKRSSQRGLQPLGLVREGGYWFLAAYCLLRQDFRLFRADRIATVQITAETFESHGEFDVRGFTQERLRETPAQWQTEVWLETTPETIWRGLVPPRAKLTVEDKGMVLRYRVNDLERYAARLLELKVRLEVRSPPELKTAFRTVAENALKFSKGSSISRKTRHVRSS